MDCCWWYHRRCFEAHRMVHRCKISWLLSLIQIVAMGGLVCPHIWDLQQKICTAIRKLCHFAMDSGYAVGLVDTLGIARYWKERRRLFSWLTQPKAWVILLLKNSNRLSIDCNFPNNPFVVPHTTHVADNWYCSFFCWLPCPSRLTLKNHGHIRCSHAHNLRSVKKNQYTIAT